MATKKTEPNAETPTEQATAQAEAAPVKIQGVDGVYYIVNPAGAIHGVDREHARDRLKIAGWRLASEEEVATYKGQPIQRADRPICQPWNPDPDAQLEAL